jgi:uncharacterized protein
LAAPVINPIVIASTWAAFGNSIIFWGRLGFTFLIAVMTGLIFSLYPNPADLLHDFPLELNVHIDPDVIEQKEPLVGRLRAMLVVAGEEFFEMGRYLVIGSLLAALLQTFVPQGWLLSFGRGSLVSVLVMILLAVLLSVCSTVDAFIALAFTSTFTSGAILAFLVYGPMVDIKSTLMFLRVFKRRGVAYLVLLPMGLTVLATVILNNFLK